MSESCIAMVLVASLLLLIRPAEMDDQHCIHQATSTRFLETHHKINESIPMTPLYLCHQSESPML
jgi:hypothetical protein